MSVNDEKVSIIIPIYNTEKYLRKCIDSIINQTYKNLEIILINDGSTDNSKKICDEYKNKDDRIKVINKENSGISATRNMGLDAATGNWMIFVDSDDWVKDDMVEKLLNIAKKENAEIVQCNSYYAYEKEEIKRAAIIPNYQKRTDIENIKLDIISPKYDEVENNTYTSAIRAVHGKLYKSEILKNKKFLEDIFIFEDGIFLLNVLDNVKKYILVNEYLYYYRISENSISKKFSDNYLEQIDKIMKNINLHIEKQKNKIKYESVYYAMCFEMISSSMTRYFFNKNNKNKHNMKLLKDKCEKQYKNVIEKVDKKYLNSNQKILLFLLKKHMYFLICIMYKSNIYKLKKRK